MEFNSNNIGSGLLGIGGGLLNLFSHPSSKEANNYLAQMQPYVNQYLQPYVNAGQGAMQTLQGQYQNLLNNPTGMLSSFGAGYQASPGYQYNVDQATKAANNAAAAGGFIGSPQQQEYMAKQIGGLASQDYNQYLNNIMGLYGQGLQGMGGINQMGYGASKEAVNTLADMLNNQASLAYNQAMQKSETKQSGLGGILGGVGKLFGLF